MPVNPNPVDKDALGQKGRDLNRTVSENALDFDISTVGAGAVAAHINDPVGAHKASAISVLDTADHYVSDQVEGVTAEIGETRDLSRQDGVLVGGGYSAVGLNVTLDAGTKVQIAGISRPYGGDSVALAPTAMNFIYIDKVTRSLAQTVGAPPDIADGVVLWMLYTDATSVVLPVDVRYFITNSDRKDAYTVCAGTDEDSRSEGNFRTLVAALAYLEMYGAGVMADRTEHFRILIRGDNSVGVSLTLPGSINGITIEGDGRNAILRTGATVAMFNLNAHDRLTLRNITFLADHVNSVVVYTAASTGADLLIENCRALNNTQNWSSVVRIQDTGTVTARATIRNCDFETEDTAIRIDYPTECSILDCTISAAGGSSTDAAISLGIAGGPIATSGGNSRVVGCHIQNFDTGIFLHTSTTQVTGCTILGAQYGIDIDDGTAHVLSDNSIVCGASNGVHGIQVNNHSGCRISDNWIKSDRTVYAGERPRGINLMGGTSNTTISGCEIQSFMNDVLPDGAGIYSDSGSENTRIVNCAISNCALGIAFLTGEQLLVSNCNIREGASGILCACNDSVFTGVNIILGSADALGTGGIQGMWLLGLHQRIDSCYIENPRTTYATNPVAEPRGIWVTSAAEDTHISNTTCKGFYNPLNTFGQGIYLDGDRSSVQGGYVSGCHTGIEVDNDTASIIINGVRIDSCVAQAIYVDHESDHLHVKGCEIVDPGADYGIYVYGCNDVTLEGNTIECNFSTQTAIELLGDGTYPVARFNITNNALQEMTITGILVSGEVSDGQVMGNTVDGYQGTGVLVTAVGIFLEGRLGVGNPHRVNVIGNNVLRCWGGILGVGEAGAPIRWCSFNDNEISYCANDAVNYTTETFQSQGAHGIGIYVGWNVVVQDNTIHNIGELLNDGGGTFYPIPNSGSNGIFIEASTEISVRGNRIQYGKRFGTGRSHGIRFRWWNIAGSLNWDNFDVSGNTIIEMVGTAIEMVHDAGTITPTTANTVTNVTIHNNQIRETVGGPTPYCHGIHLDGGVQGTWDQVTISDNTIRDTFASGIVVETTDSTAVKIANVSITGNNLYDINGVNYAGQVGISVQSNASAATEHSNITISNNSVEMFSTGAVTTGVYVTANVTIDKVIIEGNRTIKGDNGIEIFAANSGSEVTNVVINNNQVFDCTNYAIGVLASQDRITEVLIDGNQIVAPLAESGIEVWGSNSGERTRDITITNNSVNGPRFAIDVYSNLIRDIVIADNITNGDSSNPDYDTGRAIQVRAWGAAVAPQMENVQVRSNTIRLAREYGIFVQGTGSGNVLSIDVSDNNLDTVAVAATTNPAIYFDIASDGYAIEVNDNTFRACLAGSSTVGVISYFADAIGIGLKRSSFSRNIINSCNGTGILLKDTTSLGTGTGTFGQVNTCHFDGNQMFDLPEDGLNLNFIHSTNLESVTVDRNLLTDVVGDSIMFVAGTETNSVNNQISIDGNECLIRSGTGQNGIYFSASDISSTTGFTITNLSICNNKISDMTDHGVFLIHSPRAGTSLNELENFTFMGNQILRCGNLSDGDGTSSDTAGVFFVLRGDSSNVVVSNNVLLDNHRTGFAVHLGVNNYPILNTRAGTSTAWIVQGNIARGYKTGTGAIVNSGGRVGSGGSNQITNGICADNINGINVGTTIPTPYQVGNDLAVSTWPQLDPGTLWASVHDNIYIA